MSASIEYFGIRHHGPGSARCLEAALDELRPSLLLIEGPADAGELLPLLGDAAMCPPVALLAYETADPRHAIFWPFAEYSPEYRAIRWALEHGAEVQFIDLPAATKLALLATAESEETSDAEEEESEILDEIPAPSEEADGIESDPLGALAAAAGYEDGESWWSDVIEESREGDPVFPAVADAMRALRESAGPSTRPHEAKREAWMRRAIRAARKNQPDDAAIAVICGAWHVPALTGKHSAQEDRALLTRLPKVSAALTWVPWTAPRLAAASGYGAGVRSPGWYAHLWEKRATSHRESSWLVRTASLLRERGHIVSTASIIEAERLATALAAMRQRPSPGFEELREATISCLCFGERVLWETIAIDLLIGSGVGQISTRTPLSPLMEDLQRQQKKAKLKPEALQRELALDLRFEAGALRSTLLHRLALLEVPWGRLTGAGKSRGTFRENWTLEWQPEFSVQLIEKIIHGPTIEQAATHLLIGKMREQKTPAPLAELIADAMNAQLEEATTIGVQLLGDCAAQTSDCLQLLQTIAPMAEISRYGHARRGMADSLSGLLRQIALEAFIALPYAARGLDAEAATQLAAAMVATHQAVHLAEFEGDDLAAWHEALRTLLHDDGATARLAGVAARLLYDAAELPASEAALLLGRKLSPGTVTQDAAGYFEGFLEGITAKLIHDPDLLGAVDAWLSSLEEEALIENLPLFRRVFSTLDRTERMRLLQAVLRPEAHRETRFIEAPDLTPWQTHLTAITELLEKGAPSR